MHSLLEKQLKKASRQPSGEPDYKTLLELVNKSYEEHDRLRRLSERSVQLMSDELHSLNAAILREKDETEMRFKLAMQGSSDGIWDFDIKKGTIWLSARCKEMLGYPDNELEHTTILAWKELVTEDNQRQVEQFLTQHLCSTPEMDQMNEHTTLKFRHKSGDVRHIMCRASAMYDDNNHIQRLVGVQTDITTIMRMQEELVQERNKANAANKAKSDFLANMSHEIRTPMNSIMGMTNLLLDCKLEEQYVVWLKIIKNSSESLLNIINDILDLSKIEADRIDLERSSIDLIELIEEVMDSLSYRSTEKHIDLLVHYHLNTPRYFLGDPVRIRQILINLINNAIKFTKTGYILVSVIPLQDSNNNLSHLRFEIKDTGIGIPEDKTHYIFEKFSQAEESTTRNFGGTGLGLAICKKLIALMGGTINVKSVLNHGSTFYFDIFLPVDHTTNKRSGTPDIQNFTDLKILVIEESIPVRKILRDYFKSWGIHANFCRTSHQALSYLQRAEQQHSPYHMVLVDSFNEGMEQHHTVRFLHKEGFNSPYFIAMAAGEVESIESFKQSGFSALVTKPFLPSQMMDILMTSWLTIQNHDTTEFITRHNIKNQRKRRIENPDKNDYSHLSILLSEDVIANQLYFKAVMARLKCQVDVAGNGLEAINAVKNKSYDIIFMDCQMPEMDGFQATAQIRALSLDKQPFIIALTADAMQGDREKCLQAGMDDYLNKPVKAENLTRMLEKYGNDNTDSSFKP